jgi:WhiB family redox-sensing transcriptional regulator
MSKTLEWLDKAVCVQVGGDLFFPEKGEYTDQAKAMCRSCEARVSCLAWALKSGERAGIFGGFTERPRLAITRQHRAGKSLEDIIAEDDAAFYARTEALGTAKDRRLAAERRRRRARNERAAAASPPVPQSREAAA